MPRNWLTVEEALAEDLQDPEFRARWEATALARAVALFLVRYRAEHHLSQTALARTLGMRQTQVARLEDGEHEPGLGTLRRLAEVLGMSLNLAVLPSATGGEADCRVSISVA